MKRLAVFFALCISLSAPLAHAQTAKAGRKAAKNSGARGAVVPLPPKATPRPSSASRSGDDVGGGEPLDPSAGNTPQSPRRVGLDAGNALRLNYGFPSWNKSPTQIDTASMLMREGSSGRTVQIFLTETEPDSSVFSGIYSISWRDAERLQVEFYVPPQDMLSARDGLKKIIAMITSKQLRRKPFILRRAATGTQSVEIFDTKEQALTAMKAYRAEQQLQTMQDQRPTKVPSDQQLDTARLAEELRAKESAAQAVAERIRMEQIEARRLQELQAKQKAMQESERAARREQGKLLAAEGLALFQQEKFPEAKEKFDKAIEADPENRQFAFQYGVTLYRLDEFNRAIVMLRLAEGGEVNALERDYFLGLNHFRIREFEPALEAFGKVVEAKHPELSPSALFYQGVVQFEKKDWDKARPTFQAVLDSSKDPRLDERAEQYLEQILRIQQFEAERQRKWLITATIGEMYDSNVILVADSARDTGTATNSEGLRSLLTGGVRFRPIYEETTELAAQLDVIHMYTVDSSFKSQQSLRNADPTIASLTVPWTKKGVLFGNGFKVDIAPGFETTYMSLENNENKEILQSYLLNTSALMVMSNRWFSTYALEIRSDNSKLNASVGDDNASALKTKLGTTNLFFVTDDKSKILTADAGYTLNQAQGRNAFFNRIDLGVGYIHPLFWDMVGNVKLGYFNLAFPQRIVSRNDNSYTVTLGASKKIDDTWSTGFMTSYNVNNSTTEANQFQKLTALLTFSANLGF